MRRKLKFSFLRGRLRAAAFLPASRASGVSFHSFEVGFGLLFFEHEPVRNRPFSFLRGRLRARIRRSLCPVDSVFSFLRGRLRATYVGREDVSFS